MTGSPQGTGYAGTPRDPAGRVGRCCSCRSPWCSPGRARTAR